MVPTRTPALRPTFAHRGGVIVVVALRLHERQGSEAFNDLCLGFRTCETLEQLTIEPSSLSNWTVQT